MGGIGRRRSVFLLPVDDGILVVKRRRAVPDGHEGTVFIDEIVLADFEDAIN
jgi:hypothetical protein